MRYTIESDFSKHVKGAELHRVYLLYGTQTYLIELYEKLLLKKALGGEFNEFNLHRFEGQTLDLQAFYDAVESLPFFSSGNRCVTLDIEPDRLDAGQMNDLKTVLADPPSTTTVIITVKSPPAKKEKLTALIKVCDKVGGVIELGARRSSDTLRFLRDRASRNGCELSSDVANYLVARCTDDLQLLATELDKLCAYVGEGPIGKAEVDAVIIPVLQARVYDLSRAIFRGNHTKAMELVDQLSDLREPVARVLAALSGAFVDLYRGFAARQAGKTAVQSAADLGYAKNREFVIRNAMSDSEGYSAPQLGQMLGLLADADYRLKSSGGNDRVILEQTVTQLFLLCEAH
ncbi:MAG: DNA polymerase III subunit delta [Anaerotruncus sp.]|nr:DNA polymerase III subunit delta [Anaerotruncus sp.]